VTEDVQIKLRVARLPYVNVIPFFLDDSIATELTASPRQLGYEAITGRIDAGPLSLLDTWRLEQEFEPVGDFGIAVRGPARSVLLFSKKPLEGLSGAIVGITDHTATSVKLLHVLLEHHYDVKPDFREGFSPNDEARLVIGDDALMPSEDLKKFNYTFDLGREWYLWRERPFVFARWVVRKTVASYLKEELRDRLDASLHRFEKNPDTGVRLAQAKTHLPPATLRNYLTGFVYRLTKSEQEGETAFRALLHGKPKGCC
jgi:chorismate dehydratase